MSRLGLFEDPQFTHLYPPSICVVILLVRGFELVECLSFFHSITIFKMSDSDSSDRIMQYLTQTNNKYVGLDLKENVCVAIEGCPSVGCIGGIGLGTIHVDMKPNVTDIEQTWLEIREAMINKCGIKDVRREDFKIEKYEPVVIVPCNHHHHSSSSSPNDWFPKDLNNNSLLD